MDELRRGPWTVEEDLLLVKFVTQHGEGRWNALARCAGLKRTGKSCRLRWLNYLRPDVRRGNITAEEQLLILELHSRWGNRWSKIAQYLPGRTDNEIKNYWRTRVQKHAKQLRCDVNSKMFRDAMQYVWMPRLIERIRAAGSGRSITPSAVAPPSPPPPLTPPLPPPQQERSDAPPTMDGQLSYSFSDTRAEEEFPGGGAAECSALCFPTSFADEERGFWQESEEAFLDGGFLWSVEEDDCWPSIRQ